MQVPVPAIIDEKWLPEIIEKWFEEGQSKNATHLIVVCGRIGKNEYCQPIFTKPQHNVMGFVNAICLPFDEGNVEWQNVFGVYDLSKDLNEQKANGKVYPIPEKIIGTGIETVYKKFHTAIGKQVFNIPKRKAI